MQKKKLSNATDIRFDLSAYADTPEETDPESIFPRNTPEP